MARPCEAQDLPAGPAMVVDAESGADVQAAVLAARDRDLPLAVYATGHGTLDAGDDGVMLRTAAMASVLVDPDQRIARVGPGALWGQVIDAAAPFGLAPLSGSHRSVGVTGYTLGGGLGWLGRLHGFAADSVLRAEVVTASGHRVVASPNEHPDLFWALRGGGGNFGVVTSLDFELHPVERVYAGTAWFALERAADTLACYRDWVSLVPDEMSSAVLLAEGPDGDRMLALKVMYAGPAWEAERMLVPLRAAAGPELAGGFQSMTYADAEMGGTGPVQLHLLEQPADLPIDALLNADSPAVEVRHWGGALSRGDGPVGGRSAQLSVIAESPDPALARALSAHSTGGSFRNFLKDPTRTAAAYSARDYEGLRDVKRMYDPGNLFRVGHNIAPARWTVLSA